MRKSTVICLALLLAIVILSFVVTRADAQSRDNWTWQTCYTNVCIQTTLNNIGGRARDAKLTTWSDKTYVWYRQ